MAKITRKTQKIFASNAGATGITEYGSPAGGTPVYSTDLDDIQTTAYNDGWSAAALAGSEIPTFQDFNAIHYVLSNQIGYLLQDGMPDFDTGTTYYQFSIVRKTGTYELYGSLINANVGNALPSQVDDANWKYLGDLANIKLPDTVAADTGKVMLVNAAGDGYDLISTNGTAGKVLTSNGTDTLPSYQDVAVAGELPVGSIYMNKSVATNPSTLLGYGTWVAITDKFIVSRGGTYTSTGGASTMSLNSGHNGPHNHTILTYASSSGAINRPQTANLITQNGTHTTESSGSGTSFSIIPPYQAVYTWERTV